MILILTLNRIFKSVSETLTNLYLIFEMFRCIDKSIMSYGTDKGHELWYRQGRSLGGKQMGECSRPTSLVKSKSDDPDWIRQVPVSQKTILN